MQWFYAASSKGGAAMFLAAALMLLLGILAGALWPELMPATAWVMWYLLNLVAIYVAMKKMTAPAVLACASQECLTYYHEKGQWSLDWQNVLLVQQIELKGESLNWIGIRIADYHALLDQIPLRLAVYLLMEQRGVWLAAVTGHCADGQCASDYLQVNLELEWQQRQYRGVQAMFLQRMQHLRQLFGVDLLIPADLSDVSTNEFCRQMNRHRLAFSNENNG